jgi:hypothetical protein
MLGYFIAIALIEALHLSWVRFEEKIEENGIGHSHVWLLPLLLIYVVAPIGAWWDPHNNGGVTVSYFILFWICILLSSYIERAIQAMPPGHKEFLQLMYFPIALPVLFLKAVGIKRMY